MQGTGETAPDQPLAHVWPEAQGIEPSRSHPQIKELPLRRFSNEAISSTMEVRNRRGSGAAMIAVTVSLPLLGAWLRGPSLTPLFSWPPPVMPANYPRFSWLAAALAVAPIAGLMASWASAWKGPTAGSERRRIPRAMPAWGWMAIGWTLAWWLLAWTRFRWFSPLQLYTFFPLWLGFVVGANALTWRRAGTCLMLRDSKAWLRLFIASSAFWWVFEWLNRFGRNWRYLNAEAFGPLGYAVHATLCFSTVLPAVT